MTAGDPRHDPAEYARLCAVEWVEPWAGHDDVPAAPEEDDGPLDFSAGEAPPIRFDSQAHWLQSCLRRLIAPDLGVDGAPGNRTRAATKEFQRRVREFVPGAALLGADGLAGPATVAALEAATATWAPDHGAVAATVRTGEVGVTPLRGGRVRVDAEGRTIDLAFEARTLHDRDGRKLVDPHGLARREPALAVAALAELGLDPEDAAILRATGLGGPGSLDTTGPGLVALGLGFHGRGGGIAALLAAIAEDPEARDVHARLLAPLGLAVEYATYRRLDPASGDEVEREAFELVLTDGDAAIRGDEAWAAVRGQPHRLGALALAAADPRVARVQAQLWRTTLRERLLHAELEGGLAIGDVVRTEVGVAAVLLLARRGFAPLRAWLRAQLTALAARFPKAAVRDPAAWAAEPALEAALVDAARARLGEAERARLTGLRGAAAPGPVRAAVVETRAAPAGDGYVEKRVKVSTYGTLAADSRLLVAVPAASAGPKRLHVVAAAALARMTEAARRDLGIDLKLASAWRAHRWTSRAQYEAVLVKRFGSIAEGKRWLGFDSPHETGLAIDIGVGGLWPSRSTAEAQKRQPLHQWLIARAWEFGWYPYKVEPWHWEHPLGLAAFRTGVVAGDDPLPAAGALAFGDADDEDDALEDSDLDELPTT